MSDEPLRDDYGQPVIVGRTQLGEPCINVRNGMRAILLVFTGERLDAFREAIDSGWRRPMIWVLWIEHILYLLHHHHHHLVVLPCHRIGGCTR